MTVVGIICEESLASGEQPVEDQAMFLLEYAKGQTA